MSIGESIRNHIEWCLHGKRPYLLAVTLFSAVALTGTVSPDFLVVHNFALLVTATHLLFAGSSRASILSAFSVGMAPSLGGLTGQVLRDTLVVGHLRGEYLFSVFTIPRVLFVVGTTIGLYATGFFLGELGRRVSQSSIPNA